MLLRSSRALRRAAPIELTMEEGCSHPAQEVDQARETFALGLALAKLVFHAEDRRDAGGFLAAIAGPCAGSPRSAALSTSRAAGIGPSSRDSGGAAQHGENLPPTGEVARRAGGVMGLSTVPTFSDW